jgi:hypothetical protein
MTGVARMVNLRTNKSIALSSRGFRWLATLLVTVLVAQGGAVATTVSKLSLEELVRKSGRIILGRCLSTESRWNQGNTLIYTYSKFAVTENFKGRAGGFINVVTVGGTVDGITQTVSGMPQFEQDEEVVLFLEPSTNDLWQPVGLSQGKFRIVKDSRTGDTQAILSLSGLQLYGTSSGNISMQDKPQRIRLGQLIQRIKSLVGK